MPSIVTKGVRPRFESVLNKVLSAWTVGESGGLTSSEWGITFYEDALSQLLIREGSGLSEVEFKSCVTGAARDLAKAGQSGSDAFDKAYSERRAAILALDCHRYFGLTRCAFYVDGHHWIPINFLGFRASICTEPPPGLDLSEFFISGYGRVYPARPRNGLYVLVGPVSSRSKSGALEIVSDELITLLGFIAAWIDYGRLSHRIGRVGPITEIRPGESVILFDEKSARIEEEISYFTEPTKEAKWLAGNAKINLLGACEAASKLGPFDRPRERYLRTAFRLYHDAVTATHPDEQITKFWKLAEFATFSSGGSVDKIARRLSLTWRDSDLIYAISFAAGQRRNIIAHHSGDGVSSAEIVEYFRYVLGIFIASAMSSGVTSLRSWRSILEVGSSGFDLEVMQDAVSVLRKFSQSHGAPEDDEG